MPDPPTSANASIGRPAVVVSDRGASKGGRPDRSFGTRVSRLTLGPRRSSRCPLGAVGRTSHAHRANSVAHVFPDAEAADLHFEGADERARAAYENLEPAGLEVYGRMSPHAAEAMRRMAASAGVPLTVQTETLAGFLRLTTG
jgi:hypothetical protein